LFRALPHRLSTDEGKRKVKSKAAAAYPELAGSAAAARLK
jgi:hypothetical protein